MTKGSLSNPIGRHLSEPNFRRFEPHLKEFLTAFPSTVEFVPTDLATTTFAARLRDAANAFITNGYESTMDRDGFAQAWSQTIVTEIGSAVIVGMKAAIRDRLRADVEKAPQAAFLCEISNPSVSQLDALALLYATGVFSIPSRFTPHPVGWKPHVPVAVEQQPDGWYIML